MNQFTIVHSLKRREKNLSQLSRLLYSVISILKGVILYTVSILLVEVVGLKKDISI